MFQKELSECEMLVLEVIFLLFIKKKPQKQCYEMRFKKSSTLN